MIKAELQIDHKELAKVITHEVINVLKPLLVDLRKYETLLTVHCLAEYLQVSDKWVYERVQLNEIPYYKIGGNLRFKRYDIDQWLNTLKSPAVNTLSAPLKIIR